MEYRTLPNTDIRVPVICLGSMTWGKQNTEEDAHAQLDYALAHGVNFIDTAEMYPVPPEKELQGTTERFIGSWIKKRGKRDDLVIASKVGASNLIGTRPFAGERTIYDRANIRAAIEGSLSRLETEYLDLYQVHWPERKTNFFGPRGYEHDPNDVSTPIEETLAALDELVKEGKVRAIGVSNETPWGVGQYLRLSKQNNVARISTIQNQYSLLNRTFEIGLAEVCIKSSIGLLAYSPLSMGVLTGKYLNGARPAGARFTLSERNQSRYNPERAQHATYAYIAIAQKYGLDPAAMALAFIASRPFTTSVIIGATNMDQLATDIDAGNLSLSDEVLEDIREVYEKFPDPTS
jgi:aryl-alcohol dehydrogenase-like predicted oxidoreductase